MKKILAIKNRRLGDTALWTSALEALHDFAGGPIDIAYPAAFKSLFFEDPRFSQHYLLGSTFSSNLEALRKIRRMKYDAVLNFHASNQTKFLSCFSKANQILIHSHNRKTRSNRYSKTIPNLGVPMSAIERDLNVVRGLGWKDVSPKPRLLVGQKFREKGQELLKVHLKISKKKIAFHVGASRPSKQWPLDKFISLARILREKYQIFVFYDFPNTSSLWDALGNIAELIHTSNLPSLIGCLSWMDGFVGADSGVKHLAAALGLPTVSLFGPESIGEWHGYNSKRHRALQVQVACREQNRETPDYAWCGYEICPLASHACMSQISVEQVEKELNSLFLEQAL